MTAKEQQEINDFKEEAYQEDMRDASFEVAMRNDFDFFLDHIDTDPLFEAVRTLREEADHYGYDWSDVYQAIEGELIC